ncbi:MAG: type I 3-dehydroquinate dehydratase [Phycisphaeraceae bacterium]|nr:type I 3-dehydroquinate dehydratase [Phycisphaeraceae bacterium]
MPTLVCVPIAVEDHARALEDAHHARLAGADLVEFRLDASFDGSEPGIDPCLRLVRDCPLPCIATCRPTWEGGHYDGDEPERVALFERLGTSEQPPRYIDVELAAYTRSMNLRQKVDLAIAHEKQQRPITTGLILSLHDFETRPADLSRRLLQLREQHRAAIHKIAFRARSVRDNIELFDILRHRDRPTIALGMGRFGLMSRVLAPKFGALLTFASLYPTTTTAPGQPTIADLLGLYRFRNIGPHSKVFGIVGDPVEHSRSPAMHNAAFEHTGFDGVYLPMPVTPGYESLKATLAELLAYEPLHLAGVSVTMPHKESLVRLAKEMGWHIDALAERCGSANTLVRDDTGVRVLNTDGPAVVRCLQRAGLALPGSTALVLGAGGMARSAAFALADAGANLLIHNRTADRAAELAERLPRARHVASLEGLPGVDAVVHCTPVGMADGPEPQGLPMSALAMGKALLVETIYHPRQTPLVLAARERGLRVIDGLDVLVEQAGKQFRAFTGRDAPATLLHEAAKG